MVIFFALASDLVRQLVEVGHYEGVDNFNVLVILGGEVVFHETNFLAKHVDLLFVLSHVLLRLFNEKLTL